MRKMKFWSIVSLLSLCFASSIAGKTDTILILHTNDIHDHVRPDYDGVGGLPYVSGYIRQMKSERKDVLVLDAGDVAEKGDMVAFATHSEMTYEALARIGYHAGAPGNHEHDFVGIPGLKKFESLAGGMKMLCINLIDENKRPRFDPSAIFDIDGVRVGVIGMIVSRKENCLDKHETAVAMAREAERLEPLTDLIVASCHFGSSDCADISRVAPNIDVFVSGHSHEVLRHHMRVPETGAVIVQAGSYAEYVGRLEIVLDMDSEKMIEVNSELVPMDHDTIPVDGPMLQWIRIKEKELTPEASRIIASSDVMIGPAQVGQLAATALREYGNSDVGFCAADQVIRAGLPIGPLDVNAFFRTGGERGYRIVKAILTGDEIEAYLNGMQKDVEYVLMWSGFSARKIPGKGGESLWKSDLEPEKPYTVTMPELEWNTRFLRFVDKAAKSDAPSFLEPLAHKFGDPAATDFSFTDAVCHYVENKIGESEGLAPHLEKLRLQSFQN